MLPATPDNCADSRSKNVVRLAASGYDRCRSVRLDVTTRDASTPKSTRSMLSALCSISPAPTSRVIDPATSTPMSTDRARCRARESVPPRWPSRPVESREPRSETSGTRVNTSVTRSPHPRPIASTVPSIATAPVPPGTRRPRNCSTAGASDRSAAALAARPAAVAAAPSTRPSTTSSLASSARLAPSAIRMARSFSRRRPRTSSSTATFAAAMTSTSAAPAAIATSIGRAVPT